MKHAKNKKLWPILKEKKQSVDIIFVGYQMLRLADKG